MTLPALRLSLTPRKESRWTGFEVTYEVELEGRAAGDMLLSLPQNIASVPGAPYRTEDLTVTDEAGRVPLIELDSHADSSGAYRRWGATRDTKGALGVSFFAPVRPHDELTPVGPLFDLRAEDTGLFGAGVTFLPLPGDLLAERGQKFAITLTWHLPEGTTGVSSHGAGDATWNGPLRTVAFSFYGAGTPRISPEGSSDFGIHAYSETPFDLDGIAEYVSALHRGFTDLFEDSDSSYHVLIRKNLGRGTGGTALPGSFAFGFSAQEESSSEDLRNLLAHEMAHNWPRLDTDHQEGAWYTEGTAEYYSLVLPLRLGLLPPETFAKQLTDRFHAYDTNPLRTLDNAAAAEAFWIDPRAQRIPYGRGLRYLIATDAFIRSATGNASNLDDVVLDVLRTQRGGEAVGIEGWLARIEALAGSDARRHFDDMMAGREIEMPAHQFEEIVVPREIAAVEYELGFDPRSFTTPERRVEGLRDGSNAARAGLRDGDRLVDLALPYRAVRDSRSDIDIAVTRDGDTRTITYAPAGDSVTSTRWEVA